MRRILIFLICACLLSLSACSPAPPAAEQPQQPQAEEPAPPIEGPGQPEPLLPSLPAPLLELALTEEPARYAPTATITPLTNSPRLYSNCVVGELVFIRADDFSRVELPAGVKSYQAVLAEEDSRSVLAYALLDENNRMAFMSVEGQILTDFIYISFGEDYIHFPNQYGYVVVQRGESYGLLNLASGKEVIAPAYNSLWPYKYALLAQQDENYLLLDYNGQVLFEFGSEQPAMEYPGGTEDPGYYRFYGAGYTYSADTGELFRHEHEYYTTHYYGGMTIVRNDNGEMAIYDQWKNIRFEARDTRNYYTSGGAVLITYGHTFVDIITPGDSHRIDIPRLNAEAEPRLEFDGANITFCYEDENDSCLIHKVVYDWQGAEKARFSEYDFVDYGRTNELPIRLRFAPEYSQQLEDNQGNILIPFGRYGYLWPYPPFIIGKSINNSDKNFDILSMDGGLLLSNPWGAVIRECGLNNAIVVWLDEHSCVLLHADGSTTTIPDPPQAEQVYYGG